MEIQEAYDVCLRAHLMYSLLLSLSAADFEGPEEAS